MKMLMITWTDIFEGTGVFFQWIFKGMRVLGQSPNLIIWIMIISNKTNNKNKIGK